MSEEFKAADLCFNIFELANSIHLNVIVMSVNIVMLLCTRHDQTHIRCREQLHCYFLSTSTCNCFTRFIVFLNKYNFFNSVQTLHLSESKIKVPSSKNAFLINLIYVKNDVACTAFYTIFIFELCSIVY